nr:hypothetical protein [Tanacetum cinerariifolium]
MPRGFEGKVTWGGRVKAMVLFRWVKMYGRCCGGEGKKGRKMGYGNDFPKSTSVTKNNVSNDFSKPITAQTLPATKKSCLKNTNVLTPGMYKIRTAHTQARTSKLSQDYKKTNKSVSFSTGVIPTTSVSRPQLKSNPKGDRVLRSNSNGKKLEVEEHRRNVKLSKNKMPVTACTDNLNAKTVNVKSISSMCAKSMMIKKHDLHVPKSVAKPIRKTVASESIKKPRNNIWERSNLGMTKLHIFLDMEIWFKELLKKYSKKDKIGSKPDKNGKRGEAEKSQKQSQ